ncbi:uncharacterized protein [Triticum aestivum]|uniref:uncharacterized protein n=1 Tax=Triticum aestivum TaxID=4565 RepID=UPI001D00868F|nr:uncharacterized protein LOC123130247 [Triticum aestivum]
MASAIRHFLLAMKCSEEMDPWKRSWWWLSKLQMRQLAGSIQRRILAESVVCAHQWKFDPCSCRSRWHSCQCFRLESTRYYYFCTEEHNSVAFSFNERSTKNITKYRADQLWKQRNHHLEQHMRGRQ